MAALVALATFLLESAGKAAASTYEQMNVQGFHLEIDSDVKKDTRFPILLNEIGKALGAINEIKLPEELNASIHKIKIWIVNENSFAVKPEEKRFGCITFHPSADWLRAHNMNPSMQGGIELIHPYEFLNDGIGFLDKHKILFLRELVWGCKFTTPSLKNNYKITQAYNHARSCGLYQYVADWSNRNIKLQSEARNDENWYFTVLTETYFAKNNQYPFDRTELMNYDPVGFKMIQDVLTDGVSPEPTPLPELTPTTEPPPELASTLKPASIKIASETNSNINFTNNYISDVGRMIPLRDQKYRGYDFTVSLSGDAILGSIPYEINFDTGSWTTSLPYGCLNKTKIKILEKNVKDPWDVLSDKVQGQLALTSKDGKTRYTIDNYIFYARKKNSGLDADNDSTAKWGNSILGAFPSDCPWNGLPSLPYAIACKYSSNGTIGMGIVSDSRPDIDRNWASLKSYLYIGSDPCVTNNLHWSSEIPIFYDGNGFYPDAIPGFKVIINLPSNDDESMSNLIVSDLLGTADTGAPELAVRLNISSFANTNTISRFLTDIGPEWRNDPSKREFKTNSRCLINRINVCIVFSATDGESLSYNFNSSDYNTRNNVPTHVIVGNKTGNVPWKISRNAPENRFNIGNTLYQFCPVLFWDISHKRVGLHDFLQ